MSKAELDATYLVSFAASCSLSDDWTLLRKEIESKLLEAEKRGERRRVK